MKKTYLAKKLGVSRFTILRWEKEGVLNQKIVEHQKDNELAKQNIDIENRKTLLKILEVLEGINHKLDRVGDVKNVFQSVENMLQNTKSSGIKVAEGLQNVAEYLTTVEVAHALGIARRSLNDWIIGGKIKAVKVKGKNFIPKEEAFKFIFRNVFNKIDMQTNAGNSVSIKDFKEALNKVISLSDEEINNTLLELGKEGVLSLQKIDDPGQLTEEEKKVAIEFNGRTLFFITWTRK